LRLGVNLKLVDVRGTTILLLDLDSGINAGNDAVGRKPCYWKDDLASTIC
jgi:hypothetical protein